MKGVDLSGEARMPPRGVEGYPVGDDWLSRFVEESLAQCVSSRQDLATESCLELEKMRKDHALPPPIGCRDWFEAGRLYAFASALERRAAGVPRYWAPGPSLRAYASGKAQAYVDIGGEVPLGLKWALEP